MEQPCDLLPLLQNGYRTPFQGGLFAGSGSQDSEILGLGPNLPVAFTIQEVHTTGCSATVHSRDQYLQQIPQEEYSCCPLH